MGNCFVQIPLSGSLDGSFPVFHHKMGEKISVDPMDLAQVVCQELRIERIVHNLLFQSDLDFLIIVVIGTKRLPCQ
jgi:hypothetical protein